MSKRRSYAQRRLRREGRAFLRRNRWSIVRLVGGIGGLCLVPALIGTPAYETGLIHGFFIAATAATLVFGFAIDGDGTFLIAGNLGEGSTVEDLVAAKKAGHIWGAVNNVEARGRDVDHVVLTPSGVLAVESKFRFKGASKQWLVWAASEADEAARTARLVLQSKDIGHRTEVRPVLVIWGGARRELPDVQVIRGVDVVRGDALVAWLERCSRGGLSQDNAEVLLSRLAAFADSRQPAA